MAIKTIPYLTFDGTADKAIELYQRALGAKVESISRVGDPGSPSPTCPDLIKGRVMHAMLQIGDSIVMISDGPGGKSVPAESNVQVLIDFDDPQELVNRFDALASGGTVVMAPHDAFWGAKFGMLIDAFHIHWMFNCMNKK